MVFILICDKLAYLLQALEINNSDRNATSKEYGIKDFM